MSDTPTDLRRDVALFRYGVIADLLALPPGSPERRQAMRDKARLRWSIPGSRRTRVAVETMRDWLAAYGRNGFDGLVPKPRGDLGRARRLAPDVAELLIRIKESQRRLTVRQVIAKARASGRVPAATTLAESTVHRLLQREGLSGRDGPPGAPQDHRRFAFQRANELWTSDALHGPPCGSDPSDRRKRRKACLHSFLDDATRLVPHGAFTFSENTDAFLPVFKQALLKRGIPTRLYVDNGSPYRSRQLAVICATLGIQLIHSRPYRPQGRGKIERFFRTVRMQFLPLLGEHDTRQPGRPQRPLGRLVRGRVPSQPPPRPRRRNPHRRLDPHRCRRPPGRPRHRSGHALPLPPQAPRRQGPHGQPARRPVRGRRRARRRERRSAARPRRPPRATRAGPARRPASRPGHPARRLRQHPRQARPSRATVPNDPEHPEPAPSPLQLRDLRKPRQH